MYRGHTVGVAIPAYNEEGLVGTTLEGVPSFVDRVYVVDDASTDGTWEEIVETAERLNEAHTPSEDGPRRFSRRVVPLRHEENRGVGGAIKTGYQRAREDGIDVTTVMGADDQMDPERLDTLLDPIVEDRADYTKGNRFLNRTDRGDMPAFRFVGNAVLSGLTKVASGYWACGDPQSGYTAISREALERAAVDEMYEFYGYCNDLLVKLNVAGLRVVDVPTPARYGEEESHINYLTYVPRVSLMLLRNFLWRLRTKYLLFDFHPVAIAYPLGAVVTLGGAAASLATLGDGDPGAFGNSLLVGLVGVLTLLWAMTLDMQANAELNDVDRRTEGKRERESPARAGHADRVADGVSAGTHGRRLTDGPTGNGSQVAVEREAAGDETRPHDDQV
jgi:glycosyltransferase involved in cell wall biosynthesis